MIDIGTLGGTFAAPYWMNNRRHGVGGSNLKKDEVIHLEALRFSGCTRDLALPGAVVKVVAATDIKERGEIAGTGQLPNGDLHAVLLIPCDDQHPHLACRK